MGRVYWKIAAFDCKLLTFILQKLETDNVLLKKDLAFKDSQVKEYETMLASLRENNRQQQVNPETFSLSFQAAKMGAVCWLLGTLSVCQMLFLPWGILVLIPAVLSSKGWGTALPDAAPWRNSCCPCGSARATRTASWRSWSTARGPWSRRSRASSCRWGLTWLGAEAESQTQRDQCRTTNAENSVCKIKPGSLLQSCSSPSLQTTTDELSSRYVEMINNLREDKDREIRSLRVRGCSGTACGSRDSCSCTCSSTDLELALLGCLLVVQLLYS